MIHRRGFLATLWGAAAFPLVKHLPAPVIRRVAAHKDDATGIRVRVTTRYIYGRGPLVRMDVLFEVNPVAWPEYACVVQG